MHINIDTALAVCLGSQATCKPDISLAYRPTTATGQP